MANWPVQQVGSTGENVRSVQYLLNAHGAAISVDGDFGPITQSAVQQFQGDNGLQPDGTVGPNTWNALRGNHTGGALLLRHQRHLLTAR